MQHILLTIVIEIALLAIQMVWYALIQQSNDRNGWKNQKMAGIGVQIVGIMRFIPEIVNHTFLMIHQIQLANGFSASVSGSMKTQ